MGTGVSLVLMGWVAIGLYSVGLYLRKLDLPKTDILPSWEKSRIERYKEHRDFFVLLVVVPFGLFSAAVILSS